VRFSIRFVLMRPFWTTTQLEPLLRFSTFLGYTQGGVNAAVAAITAKAKLAGLWREKVAQTDPSGENAPRYIISDHVMSEEEWIRERCRH
jgi:hypothetical protein